MPFDIQYGLVRKKKRKENKTKLQIVQSHTHEECFFFFGLNCPLKIEFYK